MQLMINGETTEIKNETDNPSDPSLTLSELITHLGYQNATIAVAVNGRFVPKQEHLTYLLQDRQSVDIVAPMQGG